jgi:DNA-binding response OmpR family regulator
MVLVCWKALQGDDRTATIPVILLSARAGEEASVEGMEAGADDYLVKPFSARETAGRVEAHLNLHRIRRESEAAVLELMTRERKRARVPRSQTGSRTTSSRFCHTNCARRSMRLSVGLTY